MKKVLIIDNGFPFLYLDKKHNIGGATVQVKSWIDGFLENDCTVTVLSKDYTMEISPGLNVVKSYDSKKGLRMLRWIYYRLPSIYAQIKKINPDVIYQGGISWPSIYYLIIANMLGVKFVMRISNDIYADDRWLNLKEKRIKTWLKKLAFGRVKYLITQNNYQQENLKKRYPNKKIFQLLNPYSFTPDSAHLLPGDRKYIAWVGLFQPQKNLGCLYEVAQKMPQHQFAVAGQLLLKNDSKTQQELEALKSLPNVNLMGYLNRKELHGFLQKATCLLNTSHYEGFSNVFLEAFSLGIPVVTTQAVNPNNVIDEFKLGVVAKDHSYLPDAINQVLRNVDYKAYSERGIQYLRMHHHPKKLANQLLSYISE